MITSLTCLEKN